MEDYKSNSHKSKESNSEHARDRKIQKVVTGAAKTRKRTDLQKFTDTFISEDMANVKSYILSDVLIPGLKNALCDVGSALGDVVKNSFERALFGESGRSASRSNNGGRVSYRQYYGKRDDRCDYTSARSRTGLDYDNVVFESRGDAERVLAELDEAIDRFGLISVNDMYDSAGITSNNFMLSKYGWTDIRNASVVRIREGYVIKMPKPMPLD